MTVLDLTADQYHADDTGMDTPTLSASVARILCAKTPLHAWACHPKLNPDWQPKQDDKFDIGVAVHSLLLQGVDLVHRVPADSWRTKEAQAQRDEARAAGRIPLLDKQWLEVSQMLDAVRGQLAKLRIQPAPFSNGEPEQTIVWNEDGVRCRARLDWIHADGRTCDDLKTSSRTADPATWSRRTMFDIGAHVQADFYRRGVRAVYGVDPEFRFVLAETFPPYAISVVSPSPATWRLAEEQVDKALAIWKACIETGRWPGYADRVHYADPPGWVESQWLEREALEEAAAA